MLRVVSAGASKHRDLALGLFERDFDNAQALVSRERRALARCPARNQEINAGFDLPANQIAQGGIIQRHVPAKRSDQSRPATSKHFFLSPEKHLAELEHAFFA